MSSTLHVYMQTPTAACEMGSLTMLNQSLHLCLLSPIPDSFTAVWLTGLLIKIYFTMFSSNFPLIFSERRHFILFNDIKNRNKLTLTFVPIFFFFGGGGGEGLRSMRLPTTEF